MRRHEGSSTAVGFLASSRRQPETSARATTSTRTRAVSGPASIPATFARCQRPFYLTDSSGTPTSHQPRPAYPSFVPARSTAPNPPQLPSSSGGRFQRGASLNTWRSMRRVPLSSSGAPLAERGPRGQRPSRSASYRFPAVGGPLMAFIGSGSASPYRRRVKLERVPPGSLSRASVCGAGNDLHSTTGKRRPRLQKKSRNAEISVRGRCGT